MVAITAIVNVLALFMVHHPFFLIRWVVLSCRVCSRFTWIVAAAAEWLHPRPEVWIFF